MLLLLMEKLLWQTIKIMSPVNGGNGKIKFIALNLLKYYYL